MITGYITRNKLIREYALIARDPSATDADRRDARNFILLLVGAADEFTDQTGERIVRIEEAIREKSVALGRDHPAVVLMRVELAHRRLIEDVLEGAVQ
jgi:hypothetical protein